MDTPPPAVVRFLQKPRGPRFWHTLRGYRGKEALFLRVCKGCFQENILAPLSHTEDTQRDGDTDENKARAKGGFGLLG